MMGQGGDHPGFLPLAEAAARLGISRLKLREAIAKGVLPARRDNEGRWRIDLTAGAPADLRADMAASPVAPEALMEALFDEIEELSADLDASETAGARLAALAEGQAAALDRALAAAEAAAADRDRLAALTGRALGAATEAEARASALRATADRALGLLDRAASALEDQKRAAGALAEASAQKDTVIAGQAGQLDRLFTLSEQALDTAAKARRAPGFVARVLGGARGKI